MGLLLSDGHAELHGNGVRICFQQEQSNKDFFFAVNKQLVNMGYVTQNNPKKLTRVSVNNNVRVYYRLNTFTFSSLTWLHELFYVNGHKVIQPGVELYLTPISLAYAIAGDGTRVGSGLGLCFNSFTKVPPTLCGGEPY